MDVDEHCTFRNIACGIRIKSGRDRDGKVHDLTYRDLQMTNVGMPILISASYMASQPKLRRLADLTADLAASYPAAPVGSRTPAYQDITFSRISATVAHGRRAGLIWGSRNRQSEMCCWKTFASPRTSRLEFLTRRAGGW